VRNEGRARRWKNERELGGECEDGGLFWGESDDDVGASIEGVNE
jgi:hypothetical protein